MSEQPVRPPSMRYPAPVRPKPQLRVNTDPVSIRPEIVHSPSISPKSSPSDQPATEVEGSTGSRVSPLSRTSTLMTAHPNDSVVTVPSMAELPGVPEIPPIPAKYKLDAPQKSSDSSRNDLLPKVWRSSSTPLSADPQIRALSSPDLAKQAMRDSRSETDTSKMVVAELLPVADPANKFPAAPETQAGGKPDMNILKPAPPRPRALTTNPGNPPSVLPPQPLMVRKSRSSYIAPISRSIHHPHHPNYVPPPPHHPSRSRSHAAEPGRPRRQNTRHVSNNYQFERSQMPRHTQSHRHQYQQDPRRYHPQLHHHHHHQPRTPRFNPSHSLPPIPRSDDVEIVYPSTRRPRSSTYGGFGIIRDGLGGMKSGARSSINLSSGVPSTEEGSGIDSKTYRGAQRTSMHGY